MKKVLVLVAVLSMVFSFSACGGPDFNEAYADISNEEWCEIGEDGTWMRIDTNPYNIDDHMELEAYDMISVINEDLGFSSVVFERMGATSSLDGIQEEETDEYSVSWSYHPNHGLDVFYEILD